jgi:hypothetical protein
MNSEFEEPPHNIPRGHEWPAPVITYSPGDREYSLIGHDTARTPITIHFCPWCGRNLKFNSADLPDWEAVRDAWQQAGGSCVISIVDFTPADLMNAYELPKTHKDWRATYQETNEPARDDAAGWTSVAEIMAWYEGNSVEIEVTDGVIVNGLVRSGEVEFVVDNAPERWKFYAVCEFVTALGDGLDPAPERLIEVRLPDKSGPPLLTFNTSTGILATNSS